jgi:hypothetical protein
MVRVVCGALRSPPVRATADGPLTVLTAETGANAPGNQTP